MDKEHVKYLNNKRPFDSSEEPSFANRYQITSPF